MFQKCFLYAFEATTVFKDGFNHIGMILVLVLKLTPKPLGGGAMVPRKSCGQRSLFGVKNCFAPPSRLLKNCFAPPTRLVKNCFAPPQS